MLRDDDDDDAIFRATGAAYSGTTRALADTRDCGRSHGHHHTIPVSPTHSHERSLFHSDALLCGTRDARARRALDTRNRSTRHTCARDAKRGRESTNVYVDGSSEHDCRRGERGRRRARCAADPTKRGENWANARRRRLLRRDYYTTAIALAVKLVIIIAISGLGRVTSRVRKFLREYARSKNFGFTQQQASAYGVIPPAVIWGNFKLTDD